MISLLFSLLFAADPWDRPEHLRLVIEEPKKWTDLWKKKYRHRFWWDAHPEKAEIQWLSPKGWKTIKKRAKPGWVTSKYPIESRFRVRFPSSSRWSEVIQAHTWFSTRLLKKTQRTKQKIPSRITTLASTSQRLWGGSIDGGLFDLSKPKKIQSLGEWDGLWDDRIIALDGSDSHLLVGSANGAVLFEESIPIRAWKEEFVSPYIQAVSIQEDDLWMGSFRGVYRVRGGIFETKLRRHSVFSITPFSMGETLIGYDGLQYFTKKDEIHSFPDWGNIYDVAVFNDQIWLSSKTLGTVRIEQQRLVKEHKETPNTLFLNKDGLWMGDKKGLYTPQGIWETKFGEVFDIIHHKEQTWLASEKGIFPYQEEKAEGIFSAYASFPKDATMHIYEEGFRLQSETPFILGKESTEEWTQSIKGWHPVALEGDWLDIALEGSRVWSLDKSGVWVRTGKNNNAKLMYETENLKEIAVSSLSVWGRSTDDRLIRFTLGKNEKYETPPIVSMSAGKSSICIGTDKGLFRIWTNTKKSMEKFHKKHAFSAVYSTSEGDCWFASTGGQVGVVYTDGQEFQWDTPSRIGTVYSLRPHGKKGLWVHSSKGLWLMRKRTP